MINEKYRIKEFVFCNGKEIEIELKFSYLGSDLAMFILEKDNDFIPFDIFYGVGDSLYLSDSNLTRYESIWKTILDGNYKVIDDKKAYSLKDEILNIITIEDFNEE